MTAAHNMEEFSAKSLFAKIHKKEIEEFDMQTYQRKPVPFILVDQQGQLSLAEDAEQLIRQIPGQISIISVCGPGKSGKSTLAGLLVNESPSAFELSHDSSVRTEGVWLWAEPIRTKEAQILVLDCQATNNIENCSNFDMKVYTLIVLISSVIVFNSRGVIDEEAIRQLTLLLCFSDTIDFSLDYGNSDEEIQARIALETPKFIWVLRDFQLAILDDSGNTMPSKDYMESLLHLPSFMGKNASNNERILKNFLNIFKDRECFTLPRPTETNQDLENLDLLSYKDLRPKFIEEFEKLKPMIMEGCPIKRINGSEVTGFQLVTMVREFLDLFNDSEHPNLYEVIDFATRVQYEEILHRAKENFAQSKKIDLAKMPFEENQIIESLQETKATSLDLFTLVKPKNQDIELEMIENFQEFFQENLKVLLKANYSASEAYNVSILETLFRKVILRLDEDYYADNFEELESDWIKAIQEYETYAKGPGKFSALSEFSRIHQHGAFNKFFEKIDSKYFAELQNLKETNKKIDEKRAQKKIKDDRQRIIDDHVNFN
jgi:hypothetical protein